MKLLSFILFILFLLSCNKQQSADYHALPIVQLNANHADLFSDSTGIYVVGIGTASNWQGEKANYFEGRKIEARFRYYEGNDLKVDQQIDMKVSGGGSRKQAQKSFNLYADKKYQSNRFRYPFFKDLSIDEFSSLRLRVSGQDWDKTHFRDALMHRLVVGTDIDVQAYQPVVVYLNDEYWGIYNLREKFNKTYLREHYNYDDDVKFDMLEQENNESKGTRDEYVELQQYIADHDLSDDAFFSIVASKIDTANFLDYYCAQIYFANTDWPGNNIKYWKPKLDEAKWRWFMHDTDLGFGRAPLYMHPGGVEHNTLDFNFNNHEVPGLHNQPWATFLLRNLMKNEAFKAKFKAHFLLMLETNFKTENVLSVIDKMETELLAEMPRHIEKWREESTSFYQSIEEWHQNVEVLRDFARERPGVMRDFIETSQFLK